MALLGNYLIRLFAIWITWLFLGLDAIGLVLFIVAYFVPAFVLPWWTFWVFIGFTGLGLIGANIRVFAAQQSRIVELQRNIATLQATLHNSPKSSVGTAPQYYITLGDVTVGEHGQLNLLGDPHLLNVRESSRTKEAQTNITTEH